MKVTGIDVTLSGIDRASGPTRGLVVRGHRRSGLDKRVRLA
jgi:hypothetical protein